MFGEDPLNNHVEAESFMKPMPQGSRAVLCAQRAMRAALPVDAELYVGRRGASPLFLVKLRRGGSLTALLPVFAAEQAARTAADEAGGAHIIYEICDIDLRDCPTIGMRLISPKLPNTTGS